MIYEKIEKLEQKLIKGNYKYQYKMVCGLEDIDGERNIPKYPVLIQTCMDSRIDVHRIFQLNPGDVLILRNAGNIYSVDAIRSMLLAIHNYKIELIIVLGHLDCGMTKIKIKELKEKLTLKAYKEICNSNLNPLIEIKRFFKPFVDEFKNLNTQVENLIDSNIFPSDVEIKPMLYDVKTGWVFENEMIKKFTYIEEFNDEYKDFLRAKRLKLIDFMEEFEESLPREQIEILEREHSEELSTVKEVSQMQLDIAGQKVSLPKIYFPKIKIRIPKIYRNEVNNTV